MSSERATIAEAEARLTPHHDLPDIWRFQLMRANRIKEQEVEFVDDEDFVASIYEPNVAGPTS